MRSTGGHLARRLSALAVAALLVLIALPATAFAQTGGNGPLDQVDEAVDESTDTVDKTVDAVEEKVDGTAGSEGDSVDQTTDTLNRGTEETGSVADRTTDDATDVVEEAAQGRLSPVDKPLKNAVSGVVGIIDSILGGPDRSRDRNRTRNQGESSSTSRNRNTGSRTGGSGSASLAEAAASQGNSGPVEVAGGSATPILGKSPLDRLIQNIGEILPQIAFPLALLALVAAFLVLQGRVDKSDPKLALAPIDVDQEYLSFR